MKLYVVGFGSGSRQGMTLEAETAIRNSDLIIGYSVYVQILKNWFPEKEYASTGMRQEKERVCLALNEAQTQNVSLICSGDAEIYGMAGLALELSENYPDVEIEIISGVTAAISGGALLGAPLTHDFAVISLSDLLTPAEKIRKRLKSAAEADFVIVLYNPSSRNRPDYLQKACDILLESKSPETVCGIARNIGRKEESTRILSLAELRNTPVDMFTTVFIGNSETRSINGRMVTPRGYRNV
ncbi:MAG: precorrin-3B C(17)-methyltransferase [Oscillospiraceae bacterium]|nr:precorrin-3B C(17)-methyltransferase [Oscillospiraceae bacterium]